MTGKALDDMSAGYSTGAAVAETKSLTSALTEATTTAATTAPALDDISAASDTAGQSATSFTQAYNQVDKSLKAAGISLGPIPGVLDEITKVSGKTITELGLLGTAGAVAAAGLAGWNIGRWVADLTGADECDQPHDRAASWAGAMWRPGSRRRRRDPGPRVGDRRPRDHQHGRGGVAAGRRRPDQEWPRI